MRVASEKRAGGWVKCWPGVSPFSFSASPYTQEELAQKARFSQHPLTSEEADVMRALVDAQRARLCACLPPVRRAAFLYLWGRPQTGKNAGKSPEKRL